MPIKIAIRRQLMSLIGSSEFRFGSVAVQRLASTLNYKLSDMQTGELIGIYPINEAVRILEHRIEEDEHPCEPSA